MEIDVFFLYVLLSFFFISILFVLQFSLFFLKKKEKKNELYEVFVENLSNSINWTHQSKYEEKENIVDEIFSFLFLDHIRENRKMINSSCICCEI